MKAGGDLEYFQDAIALFAMFNIQDRRPSVLSHFHVDI